MSDPILVVADFVHAVNVEMRQRLADVRLTLPRYAVLCRADGAMASDLARQAGVTQQAMAKTVRDLWLTGHLQKVPSDDRRSHVLRVTVRGRAALDQAQDLWLPPELVEAMQDYIGGVS